MPIELGEDTLWIDAFAVIVDVNRYATMVKNADGDMVCQFVRDVLAGAVGAFEQADGKVVAFMGDAFLGVIGTVEEFYLACMHIAKNLDRQCEYISNAQQENPFNWPFAPGGPSLKITAEYGSIEVSQIESRFSGRHWLLAGNPINYAARIAKAGQGNRCLLGPVAARKVDAVYSGVEGPHRIRGKKGEGRFRYYRLDLGDIWREGDSDETYWG